MASASPSGWTFVRFGLLVTGEGEEQILPDFLRALTASGRATFKVLRRVPQLRPVTSPKKLPMVGTAKKLTTRDEEIALAGRPFLQNDPANVVVLVDDLESAGRPMRQAVFDRYRAGFDAILGADRGRAGVFFLVNMLEAYYFAHADAVNAALGAAVLWQDYPGDVEEIGHPKGELKRLFPGFDEIRDGQKIAKHLDLAHVLDRSETCASLRVLFSWCTRKMGEAEGAPFRLESGIKEPITAQQLA